MDDARTILVVDDEDRNRRLMQAILEPLGHKTLLASSGEEAIAIAQSEPVDLVLLDLLMPGMDGFEVATRLKRGRETGLIPIVMVTVLQEVEDRVKALEAGADDFLTKPVDATEVKARVRSLLKVKAYNDHMKDYQKELEAEVAARTLDLMAAFERLKLASLDTINRLTSAAEHRDKTTGAHIVRMSYYTEAIARQMGFDEAALELIVYASPMHDIGKIGIPDHVLLKPGQLDPDEWEIMKTHAAAGARILKDSDSEFIQMGERIALSHHEKWDGTGYPDGLEGESIPIEARIAAIADVFDALTTRRPYKEPFGIEESFAIIEEGRGTHFDPAVVDAFFEVKDEILEIKKAHTPKGPSAPE